MACMFAYRKLNFPYASLIPRMLGIHVTGPITRYSRTLMRSCGELLLLQRGVFDWLPIAMPLVIHPEEGKPRVARIGVGRNGVRPNRFR
jgi:hypothetical protein